MNPEALPDVDAENVREEVTSKMLQAVAKLVANPLMITIIILNILKAKAK